MKKLLYLFAFLTVILSSCTSEDEEIQGDLITKLKFVGSDFNDSYENHEFNHIKNLYAVGPSIFPRPGAANPSLTTLALSRRLAYILN